MGPVNELFVVAVVALSLVGCQTVPTGPVQDFVSASSTLKQAESDYFDEIQAASDASHVTIAGAEYVAHDGSFKDFSSAFVTREDFSKAKAARLAALTQLNNYAQQLAAITAAATGTWISDDAKQTTSAMQALLASGGTKLSSAQTGFLQSAVQGLETAIVNNETATELRSLAVAARNPISDIAKMVGEDNENIESDNYASGLVADQKQALLNILHVLYADKSVNSAQRYAALASWQNWKSSLVTKGQAIHDALMKLEKANDALAAKQNLSATMLAQEALGAAQGALGVSQKVK